MGNRTAGIRNAGVRELVSGAITDSLQTDSCRSDDGGKTGSGADHRRDRRLVIFATLFLGDE